MLVYVMSTVWEDKYCCSNKYKCTLALYPMTVLSSSYVIIVYCTIHAPGNGFFCWWTQCNWQKLFEGTNGTYW